VSWPFAIFISVILWLFTLSLCWPDLRDWFRKETWVELWNNWRKP
jgi:hypothetical protein